MRSFMVFAFHQILLFSLSVELLSQNMFANVARFCKLHMITSLCSVLICQSEKYIGSQIYLTAISYRFLLAQLSYYSTLLSWRSNKIGMLHHYMSEFQYSEMWCYVVVRVGPDMLKDQEAFLDCLTLKTKAHWLILTCQHCVYSSWNVMAHGDAREGKWRGNWRMEWVASTLHTTSEHVVSSIIKADAHTSAGGSQLNWRPRRFKWTHPLCRKTKSGFRGCAITFQLASNIPEDLSFQKHRCENLKSHFSTLPGIISVEY